MNLYTQGVDPGLDLSDLDRVRRVVEDCTGLPVHPRHPWAGDFVHTSFAGSHQDAISKGLRARSASAAPYWDVPYLPVDPHDIGHDYRALIRVNEQSGKGGIAHLLRTGYGLDLPRRLLIEFAALVQRRLDRAGGELTAPDLWRLLTAEFAPAGDTGPDVAHLLPAAHTLAARLGPGEPVPFRLGGGKPRAGLVLECDVRRRTVAVAGDEGAEGAAGAAGAADAEDAAATAGWAACAEVLAFGLRRWGFGIADDPEQALVRAIGSAARRVVAVAYEGAGADDAGQVAQPVCEAAHPLSETPCRPLVTL
ncbi:MAG: hypothetical protein AUG49_15000 [Catenulispora sp. 13_1_20CM_3_70_7]|nr:MAG: hypothetical protein AUG49_15000 [Catenulispora sp. 13_1_20CM_3_70_7]